MSRPDAAAADAADADAASNADADARVSTRRTRPQRCARMDAERERLERLGMPMGPLAYTTPELRRRIRTGVRNLRRARQGEETGSSSGSDGSESG